MKHIKRRFFYKIFFLFLGQMAAAQSTPAWLLDKELQYPRSRYIAAVGEGIGEDAAKTAALSEISMFFSTSTNIRNKLIREFNEAVRNNTTEFSRRTYINEDAVISSDQEFLGVRFTAPYFDRSRQRWAILAYIDRMEASQIYESKIAINMASINALADDAERQTEVFYKSALLFRALKIGNITEEYIKTAAVLEPSSTDKYISFLHQIQNSRSSYLAVRGKLTFNISINNADLNLNESIEQTIKELLEAEGCIFSNRNYLYTISVQLSATVEVDNNSYIINPKISIQVEGESTVFPSYNKVYKKVVSENSRQRAEEYAFVDIKKDLQDNFITKFIGSIGR